MQDAIKAGVAVYNAGEHHAAHDAWEDEWLDLDAGTADEQFLHGLIQFTAAVYHARRRNWSGARKLATSASEYLDALAEEYRGVDVAAIRAYLGRLGTDPEYIERARPLRLRYEGRPLALTTLDVDAAGIAAVVLAEEYGYDESVVADGVRYAKEEDGTARTRFIALVMDFVADAERRTLVYDRLRRHVERRRREEDDVSGLFD